MFPELKRSLSLFRCRQWVPVFFLTDLAIASVRPALATDYALEASFNLRQIFNTNLTNQPSPNQPGDYFGTDLDLVSNFSASSSNWKTIGGLRLDNWFYYGGNNDQSTSSGTNGSFNYQNQYLDLSHSYFTERSVWRLSGNYTNASYVSSLSGIGTVDQPVGIILGVLQREIGSISPSVQYTLTERTKASLGYTYSNSKYSTTQTNQGSYPNSDTHSLFSEINYVYNENISLEGNLSYTTFITSNRTIDYVTSIAGIKYNYSPDFHINLEGGGQYTHTKNSILLGATSQNNDQISPVFTVSAIKEFDFSSISINYHRSVIPSVNATVFTTDAISLSANRRINDRLSGNLNASYQDNSYPAQVGNGSATSQTKGNAELFSVNNSQKYYQVGGNLSYSIAERISLIASYNFVYRDISDVFNKTTRSADSHNLSLDLRYDFDPLHF